MCYINFDQGLKEHSMINFIFFYIIIINNNTHENSN